MDSFRYAQFCPLARTTEILGHRWVLLILRELLVAPQRFSDLKRRLRGVSSSVLAERLGLLESHGVVARRLLPPPAAATVYELTQSGRELRPALLELARWGVRHLLPPRADDHVEPDWLRVGMQAFACPGPTPARRFELRVQGPESDAVVRVAGGPDGTHPIDDELPVDACIQAPFMVLIGLASGLLPVSDALASDDVHVTGDIEALSDFCQLFEMNFEPQSQKGASP